MSSITFPINEAQLAGLFGESVTYGIYLTTLAHCVHALFRSRARGIWKKRGKINWLLAAVAFALFSIATFDIALGFYHNFKAFIFYTGPGGPIEEFTNISDWVNVMKSVTVVLQTTIGDAVLIYRCWIVYQKSWRVISVSILLWLGDTFCMTMIIYLESTIRARVLLNATKLSPYLTAFWVLTITQNIITTGLLVRRIWKINRQVNSIVLSNAKYSQTRNLEHIMRVIVESGAIYTLTAFVSFISAVVGSTALYPVTDMEVQIVGIAFNLIIIRISQPSSDSMLSSQVYSNREAIPVELRPNMMHPTGALETQVHVVVTTNTDTHSSMK